MTALQKTALTLLALAAAACSASALSPSGSGAAAVAGPATREGQAKSKKTKVPANEKSAQDEYEKGAIALRYGLTDEAIRYGEQALAFFPGHFNAVAAFNLGKICFTEKRFDEALDYAVKSIQKDGKSARAYNLKGVILNQLGRYLEAAGSFQAGLVLAPDDIGLQINLA